VHLRSFAAALLLPALALGAHPGVAETPTPLAEQAPVAWQIDPVHSGVTFRIRHFVTRVRGKFTDFRGTITADPQGWQDAAIDVEIRTASISTDNEKRDNHLRSSDFFAADSFPTITFRSTRIERRGDDATIHGTLTMRGVTRPVVLDGHFNGVVRTPDGERVGFEATTKVDRSAFGVTWNRAMEGGGAMLGDEVEVEITVEAVRSTK
jgi:polyisoprenoid-binding protein YceI